MTNPPRRPFREKVNILLVDDSPGNLLAVEAVLQQLGHNLVLARSGAEALRQTQQSDFAVVLLDVQMPDMDGFETGELIRKQARSQHTPIIFLSAHDISTSSLARAYALGAVDYLVKPIMPEILRAKVRAFVDLFQQTQEARIQGEQFRMLIESSKDYAIFMLDPQGHVMSWNPGAERIKGYTAEEIIGQHFSRFYLAEDVQADKPSQELTQAQAHGRWEDEDWRVRKDGSRFWANVIVTALYDKNRNVSGFSKITRDITERKQAEENSRRLQQEQAARTAAERSAEEAVRAERRERLKREQLRVTLESIGDAIIVTDTQGRISLLNPVAQALTGWKNEEATGQALHSIFNIVNEMTGQAAANPVDRVLREGVVVGLANHTALIAKDGKRRPIDDSAAPIKDGDGNIIGVVLVFRDVTERRRADRALQESEARKTAILDTALDCIITIDHQGKIVEFNPAAERTFGFSREEVLGHDMAQLLVPPALRDSHYQGLARYLATGEGPVLNKRIEMPALRSDGTELLIELAITRIATGQQALFTAYVRDITERKRSEEALRKWEHVFLHAGWAVAITEPLHDTFQAVNPALALMHGYRVDELVGRPITQTLAPESREEFPTNVRIANEKGDHVYESVHMRKDGSRFPVLTQVTAFKDSLGTVLFRASTMLNLTEQKQAAQISRFLADASAALAALVDYESTLQKLARLSVPFFADWCAIDILQPDGSLRRLAVAHVDPAKVQFAHELHRRLPSDRNAAYGVWNVLRTGKPELTPEITDAALVESIKDPELLKIVRDLGLKSYMAVPLVVRGRMRGVITFFAAESGRRYDDNALAVAEDLAHRATVAIENAELYRELREADRKKDEFLAMLAHELRNPLAAIRNAVQILRVAVKDPTMVGRAEDIMEHQVQHMVRLVDDLLDVSRIMQRKIELRKERIELKHILARAVETAQPAVDEFGHKLTVLVPPDPAWLEGDVVRLAQVVANLLNNSAKYMDRGGQIWLSAECEGKELVVRVRDTGIGISPELLPRIFDLFVQADYGGSRTQGGLGIGLTLVHQLVKMHGGSVTAHSEGTGKGSEFVVRLPALSKSGGPASTPIEKDQVLAAKDIARRRILVVDDNHDAAETLAMLLGLQGQDVQVSHDGLSALEAMSAYRPDIVFLDIGMPGMNGYEVARKVRALPGMEKTMLIAMTGWGQDEDRRRSQEAGFDRHLVKPVEPAVLSDLLASLGSA